MISGTETAYSLISVFLRAEDRVRLMTELLAAVTLYHMEPVLHKMNLEVKVDTIILSSDCLTDSLRHLDYGVPVLCMQEDNLEFLLLDFD